MIGAYLTDTVTWKKSQGGDAWGSPAAPVETAVKARIDRRTRLVRNFAGEEVTAAGSVLLLDKPGHEDLLTFDGADHAILAVAERKAWGVSHYEVYVS
jgi:hypothetical protein